VWRYCLLVWSADSFCQLAGGSSGKLGCDSVLPLASVAARMNRAYDNRVDWL